MTEFNRGDRVRGPGWVAQLGIGTVTHVDGDKILVRWDHEKSDHEMWVGQIEPAGDW